MSPRVLNIALGLGALAFCISASIHTTAWNRCSMSKGGASCDPVRAQASDAWEKFGVTALAFITNTLRDQSES